MIDNSRAFKLRPDYMRFAHKVKVYLYVKCERSLYRRLRGRTGRRSGLTPAARGPMLDRGSAEVPSTEEPEQMTVTPEETRRGTQPVDFINVGSLLSEEEKGIRDRIRSF